MGEAFEEGGFARREAGTNEAAIIDERPEPAGRIAGTIAA